MGGIDNINININFLICDVTDDGPVTDGLFAIFGTSSHMMERQRMDEEFPVLNPPLSLPLPLPNPTLLCHFACHFTLRILWGDGKAEVRLPCLFCSPAPTLTRYYCLNHMLTIIIRIFITGIV